MKIYKEDIKKLWGDEFFDECNKEATEITSKRYRTEIDPSWNFEIPEALILAVAIKKIKNDSCGEKNG